MRNDSNMVKTDFAVVKPYARTEFAAVAPRRGCRKNGRADPHGARGRAAWRPRDAGHAHGPGGESRDPTMSDTPRGRAWGHAPSAEKSENTKTVLRSGTAVYRAHKSTRTRDEISSITGKLECITHASIARWRASAPPTLLRAKRVHISHYP